MWRKLIRGWIERLQKNLSRFVNREIRVYVAVRVVRVAVAKVALVDVSIRVRDAQRSVRRRLKAKKRVIALKNEGHFSYQP